MMKYIIVLRKGLELPFLFPSIVNHIDMWVDVQKMNDKVISAGFVRMSLDGKIQAFGESESIGIKGRPEEDSALLEKVFKRA